MTMSCINLLSFARPCLLLICLDYNIPLNCLEFGSSVLEFGCQLPDFSLHFALTSFSFFLDLDYF
jgi:hypothetical protein